MVPVSSCPVSWSWKLRCLSYENVNLSFFVAWNVRRPPAPRLDSTGSIGRERSGVYAKSFTFESANRLATPVVVPHRRPAAKNHIRSASTGPPSDPLKSYTFFTLLTEVSPWLRRSSSRLLLCSDSPVAPTKNDPLKRLPPSFGMLLTWAPPSEYSADPIVPRSTTTS